MKTTRMPLYRKVASRLQSKVLSELRIGDLLPSEVQLARDFRVNRRTLRQAIDVLADEGSIRRKPGRGSVVVDRNTTGEFAIVIQPDRLWPDSSPYCSMVCAAITEALRARNSRCSAKLHIGRFAERWEDHLASLDIAEPDVLRHLRGVFSMEAVPGLEQKLSAAKIPVVYAGGARESMQGEADVEGNGVKFDYMCFYDVAFAHLKEVGCRRVGVLTLFNEDANDVVARAAGSHGLEIPAGWLCSCRGGLHAEPDGYEAFCRMWKESRHADGMLVTDDIICRGVLRATLHLGIHLPGQLRLVSHANRGVAFPYHKSVTRVEFDPVALAREAVDMMLRLQRERTLTAPCVTLPGTFVKGGTT